ncbi:MAG TPA: hypothetical protein VJ385_20860 [Fibrobacteria bacterium]|nr:hypothetical protein [Fibrobacteria bacterium]
MNKNQEADEIIDLKKLILAIWGKRFFILALIVLFQAHALYKGLSTPKRYSSTSQFVFKTGAKDRSFSDIASMVGISLGAGGAPDISGYFDVLLFGDKFLGRILDRRWAVGPDSIALDSLWKLKPGKERNAYKEFRDKVDRLTKGMYINVERDKLTGVVSLKTTFEDPQVSLQVNEFILAMLRDYMANSARSQARENRIFVGERLKEVDSDLRKSEAEMMVFNQRNMGVTSPPLLLEMARLKRDATMNQEIFIQLKKQYEIARIEELKETALLDILSEPTLALKPDPRGTLKRILLATGIALVFGSFLALIWEWGRFHFGRPKSPGPALG